MNPSVSAACTVLSRHGWRRILDLADESVWQWRDCRVIVVPHRPRGVGWWPRLWEQACNVMRSKYPVPSGGRDRYRATLRELVRAGLTREAHIMAMRSRQRRVTAPVWTDNTEGESGDPEGEAAA